MIGRTSQNPLVHLHLVTCVHGRSAMVAACNVENPVSTLGSGEGFNTFTAGFSPSHSHQQSRGTMCVKRSGSACALAANFAHIDWASLTVRCLNGYNLMVPLLTCPCRMLRTVHGGQPPVWQVRSFRCGAVHSTPVSRMRSTEDVQMTVELCADSRV